jgi:hypothetical protein
MTFICISFLQIAMFHCLLQTKSKGGVNQWIDGFHAAHRLWKEDPESFDILTNTPIAYRNITRTEVGEFHNTSNHRLIRFAGINFILKRTQESPLSRFSTRRNFARGAEFFFVL